MKQTRVPAHLSLVSTQRAIISQKPMRQHGDSSPIRRENIEILSPSDASTESDNLEMTLYFTLCTLLLSFSIFLPKIPSLLTTPFRSNSYYRK